MDLAVPNIKLISNNLITRLLQYRTVESLQATIWWKSTDEISSNTLVEIRLLQHADLHLKTLG